MSTKIFKIFNPGAVWLAYADTDVHDELTLGRARAGPKEDPKDKRRAQLRRAQRTYRDRKDNYIKGLEREVAQTRAKEAELEKRCGHLCATIEGLTNLLSQYGIDVPPELQSDRPIKKSDSESPPQHISSVSPGKDETWPLPWSATTIAPSPKAIQRERTSKKVAQLLGEGATESLVVDSPPGAVGGLVIQPSLPWSTPWSDSDNISTPGFGGVRLGELDPIVVGMEFVLTIETPCLGHIDGDASKPEDPTGHALTTSAQLLFISPNSPPPTDSSKPRVPSYQKAPAAVLDRLLALSSNLCLEGEVTPTQAWEYIRCQPQFGGLELHIFRALAERLRDAVKCHGFGAVIDRTLFDSLVFETLMLGRNF